MNTKAVRLHGKMDLRLEEFTLPQLNNDEILISVITDSVCMSTYKTALQGEAHIRVPNDVAQNPAIIGHEFCAEIVQVGARWMQDYHEGEKVIIPPALSYLDNMNTIGYSFPYIGGDATYCIVPAHVVENGYLMKVESDAFFSASLVEPVSCVVRGFKETYHFDKDGCHETGLKIGGKTLLMGACGPMGLAALDCALHGDRKPARVVVTDINQDRLDYAEKTLGNGEADGVKLTFANTTDYETLMELSDGTGYDDVFVYAPVDAAVTLGDRVLAFDGCLNFFAGPTDKAFSAPVNFYNIHYAQHHFAGTSGSNTEDIRDVLRYLKEDRIHTAAMISHIGGLDAVIDTTLQLPKLPGAKKLIYTHCTMPLTAIADFREIGKTDSRFMVLADMVDAHSGLWCKEAEDYLRSNF